VAGGNVSHRQKALIHILQITAENEDRIQIAGRNIAVSLFYNQSVL
jgi:hypothetical protein